MDHFLIALDTTEGSLKSVHYLQRILHGAEHVRLTLFHVLPATSPNLLKREEVKRIEQLQEKQPHLRGYFWSRDEENRMVQTFETARRLLVEGGIPEARISTRFCAQFTEVAQVILAEAKHLNCSTIVVGRRGLSRMKELLQGSVSTTVTRMARDLTVWVVDS